MKQRTVTIIFIIFISTLSFETIIAQTSFRVMSYNVENLFDTDDDPLKEDNEYLPSGNRHWTNGRYFHKLQQIAKVISAAGEWSTPTLIGLCEVENDSVLTHLLTRTPLKNQYYRYCITHGSDHRGINVGLLYQRDLFAYISHQDIPIRFSRQKHKQTRNILHVWGKIITGDTLDIFVCHFPSRYGGEKESEPDRIDAAKTLAEICDSLFHNRKYPQIIIMGDFNDTPNNQSIQNTLLASPYSSDSTNIHPYKLYNLFSNIHYFQGTHRYQGVWNQLDQIIVNGSLLEPSSPFHLVPQTNKIFSPKFLFIHDKTYHGERPFRTYYGFKYEGGFSDHLPILADFYTLH